PRKGALETSTARARSMYERHAREPGRVTLQGANCVKKQKNTPQHFPCRTLLGQALQNPAGCVPFVVKI
ncbi:MAG: hypothetical protein LBM04_01805, partial [Opitutaceae bacterium]|nr:hypothetical protein [Opitutaceae bacterium]